MLQLSALRLQTGGSNVQHRKQLAQVCPEKSSRQASYCETERIGTNFVHSEGKPLMTYCF